MNKLLQIPGKISFRKGSLYIAIQTPNLLSTRCVAVGSPDGYSLYSLNSTDALDPVYKSGLYPASIDSSHKLCIQYFTGILDIMPSECQWTLPGL